jgi:hypothetical protein
MEVRWSDMSRGKFKGFKLHAIVNQIGLPLWALVTMRNCYDQSFLPKFIEDLETDYVLAEAGYDSKTNYVAAKAIDVRLLLYLTPKGNARRSSMLNFWGIGVMLLSSLMGTSKLTFWRNVGFDQGLGKKGFYGGCWLDKLWCWGNEIFVTELGKSEKLKKIRAWPNNLTVMAPERHPTDGFSQFQPELITKVSADKL